MARGKNAFQAAKSAPGLLRTCLSRALPRVPVPVPTAGAIRTAAAVGPVTARLVRHAVSRPNAVARTTATAAINTAGRRARVVATPVEAARFVDASADAADPLTALNDIGIPGPLNPVFDDTAVPVTFNPVFVGSSPFTVGAAGMRRSPVATLPRAGLPSTPRRGLASTPTPRQLAIDPREQEEVGEAFDVINMLHNVHGPAQLNFPQEELRSGMFHGARVKMGYSPDYNKSVSASHGGMRYTLPGDIPTTVADVKNFIGDELLNAIQGGMINLVATIYTGSLNTFESAILVGQEATEAIEAQVPGTYIAGTVTAETGLYQYGEATSNGHVNVDRNNYREGIMAAIYFNYLGKMKLAAENAPLPTTVSISHSWGCPSFLKEYKAAIYALEQFCEANGLPFFLPYDHIILVDPRYPGNCGGQVRNQIEDLRENANVDVHVIKDKAKLNGFGIVESLSANAFSTADEAGSIQVDSYSEVRLGHAMRHHVTNIQDILARIQRQAAMV